jgi:hypothetical protein
MNIKGTSDYKECRKIHFKFIKLYKNREMLLEKRKKISKESKQVSICNVSGRPEINTLSRALAEKERAYNQSRHDLLLQKG